MKLTESLSYQNTRLTVLVEADDENKATASYFLNETEVIEWSRIHPTFQRLLTVILDDICERFKLTKWSY